MAQTDPQKYELVRQEPSVEWKDSLLEVLIKAFVLVPQNVLSWMAGGLSRLRLPRPLNRVVNEAFVQIFKINMSEAELPIDDYQTIEDIFTRRLKPDLRPLLGPWISPADGYLVKSEPVREGQGLQAKGFLYEIGDLVGLEKGEDPAFAWYQTVYLAPHNYHRVHAPIGGTLKGISHIPGRLWPVNDPFIQRVPKIFTRNERLVFRIQLDHGGWVWVVMVGAFNVGRMTSSFAPFLATNSEVVFRERNIRTSAIDRPINIGDELGTFMLGSTVIIVLDHKSLEGLGGEKAMLKVTEKTQVLMGQSLT